MSVLELRQKFGKRLRYLRRDRDLTQEQLAELTGLSVNFISLVETGHSSPTAETISKLAKGLGVNEGELFRFDER
ncbi:MAG: helix-turn-helix domain-containing protein [Ktedonobacteraceae bacterium]